MIFYQALVIIQVIGDSVAAISWDRNEGSDVKEYTGVLQLMEFLVKVADVGMGIPAESQGQLRFMRCQIYICTFLS